MYLEKRSEWMDGLAKHETLTRRKPVRFLLPTETGNDVFKSMSTSIPLGPGLNRGVVTSRELPLNDDLCVGYVILKGIWTCS